MNIPWRYRSIVDWYLPIIFSELCIFGINNPFTCIDLTVPILYVMILKQGP